MSPHRFLSLWSTPRGCSSMQTVQRPTQQLVFSNTYTLDNTKHNRTRQVVPGDGGVEMSVGHSCFSPDCCWSCSLWNPILCNSASNPGAQWSDGADYHSSLLWRLATLTPSFTRMTLWMNFTSIRHCCNSSFRLPCDVSNCWY